ncbi:MAG: hypothetical protein R3290_05145 [Acidimicrobiia bacterium]|nr:hypothetical protein [Acidimicrobiia bacterium]
MTTSQARVDAANLRPGHLYTATTTTGRTVVGEYLGIEVTHGDWCLLVHTGSGVVSLPLTTIASVVGRAA